SPASPASVPGRQVAVAPSAPARPHVGGAEFGRGAGSAQGYSQQAPVGGNAGPLSGGFDPKIMAQDTAAATKAVVIGKVGTK
ncbi:MAG: hypothetical protein QOG03_420, partial [Actinomycetota bacterium]|nr:hypothetical protein [Actinomycetota bacterium]